MSVAFVILAHDKPGHLHRLVKALDGLPIFLHVDAGTSPEMHHEMTDGLPQRVRLLPRVSSGWASFGLVEAELTGYRAACSEPEIQHVVLMTGADYPLVDAQTLAKRLSRSFRDRSWVDVQPLPIADWGDAWLRPFRFPQSARESTTGLVSASATLAPGTPSRRWVAAQGACPPSR